MRLSHRTHDDLDRPNPGGAVLPDYNTAPARQAQAPATHPLLARVALGVGLGVAGLAALLLGPPLWSAGQAASAAIALEGELITWVVRAALLGGALAATLAMLGAARWIWRRATLAGLITLPGQAPTTYVDLRRHAGRSFDAMDRHFDTQAEWARASGFRNLSTYAPNSSYRYDSRNELPPALPEPEPAAVVLPVDGARPVLAQLAGKGLLGADRLLVGFNGEAAPVALELDDVGFVGIGGLPRQGKTTTALGLLGQAAYHDAVIFVCDPHGRTDKGLLGPALPLSGRFERQAVDPHEIAATVALVAKIARRRLDGYDAASDHIYLVVDEFTALIARGELPPATLAELLTIAVEAAKVKVHAILIAHDWSAGRLGQSIGTTLRRVLTHRIVHRADAGVAGLLLPVAADARAAAQLAKGEALVLTSYGGTERVRVPHMATAADLAFAARGAAPRAYTPRPLPQLASAAPARPALAPPGLTLAGRIVALLADGQARDSLAIAAQLNEDKAAVQAALSRLASTGEITRTGSPRNYVYTA
jgi:hypothetical protein